MKIKLICPTFYTPDGDLFRPAKAMMPPLTPLFLAGLVPPHHGVSVVDEAIQTLNFDDPVDLVGITSTSINIRRAYEIADEYRRRGVKVVMGGIHASTLPEEAMEHVDALVLGEAEDSWPELLADVERGTLRKSYNRPARESLEGLPFPRYDLIAADRYVKLPFSDLPMLPVQTTRGCPHNCDFCSVTRFWGKRIRFRPIPEVVAEIKASKGRAIFFTDDNFFANPKRTQELCEALEPLKIRFMCQIDTTARQRDELVRATARAGCFMAFIGVESLDPRSLAEFNKQFNKPDEYANLIRMLRKHSIGVYASIMFGLEHDDSRTVDSTVNFLIQNKVDLAAFFRLTPFPGTALFGRMKERNQLVDNQWWLHLGTGIRSLVKYSDKPCISDALVKQANKRFYSIGSIVRRYTRRHRMKLIPLLLNLNSRKKMLSSDGSCSF
jgi:radical SAM superfamily enzyme YgiQ (UPF0313 family)